MTTVYDKELPMQTDTARACMLLIAHKQADAAINCFSLCADTAMTLD